MRPILPTLLLLGLAAVATAQSKFLVIDVSGGPEADTYPVREEAAFDPAADACRTTEIWLRHIEPGTFKMGSPKNESCRMVNEDQFGVTLSGFYIGVFEVTQDQWERVMGGNPSKHKGAGRPVDSIGYDMIRGEAAIAKWPVNNDVAPGSFLGRLRKKTGRQLLDIPLEAQWEYACRTGTISAFSNGANLPDDSDGKEFPAINDIARYRFNNADGKGGFAEHTRVGSYEPNAWGLYDMHGNIAEWCRDAYRRYPETAETNSVGAGVTSIYRVQRGGGWNGFAKFVRSAQRSQIPFSIKGVAYGFRLSMDTEPLNKKYEVSTPAPAVSAE